MSEWRKIETAPKDGQYVLVWNGEVVGIADWRDRSPFGAAEWCDDGEGLPYDPQPTHWQPLPEPPKL